MFKKFFLVSSLAASSFAYAGDKSNFNLQVPIVSPNQVFSLDGELNEPQWQQAAEFSLRYETSPRENLAPIEHTQVKAFSDNQYFYVAMIAEVNDKQKLLAHFNRRDDIWRDEVVGFKIDTFNNAALAYEFFANPLGVQFDGIENELTKRESGDWDAIWYTKGKLTASGYTVEFKIPLEIMNFDMAKADQEWAVEFIRLSLTDMRRRTSTNKIDRNNRCLLCQMGVMSGINPQTNSLPWQVTPSLVVGRAEDKLNNTAQNDTEAGLDLRIPISASSVLNMTVNPDYSQIEADAGQITVNNNNAIFLNEKRAFFLDNRDYFDTPLNLLHTRNLISPEYGAKFTTQQGAHTLGVLAVEDEFTQLLDPSNFGSRVRTLAEKSQNFAGRYRYDISNGTFVGGSVTYKQGRDFHNALLSLDSKVSFNDQLQLVTQFSGSQTDNESEVTTGGQYYAKLSQNTRDYSLSARYERIDPDYLAGLGWVSMVDYQKWTLAGGYVWYLDDHFFSEVSLSGDWDITHDTSGVKLEQEAEAYIEASGAMQSYFELGYLTREQRAARFGSINNAEDAPMFDQQRISAFGKFKPTTALTLELYGEYGDAVDYSQVRAAKNLYLSPELGFEFWQGASLFIDHGYQKMTVEDKHLFTANLTDVRFQWYFDLNQFIRLSSIYQNVERNPNMFLGNVAEKSESLASQFLYGYQLNPFSVFYLGTSNGMVKPNDTSGLQETERSYFAKVSYALSLF
ncbi:carbohydrate binding family 9 domain-containing protein [Paraferrimonas sp. SM1919]|uniref:carbohydrate binding family 9 domain-containing protein n=1 Tax=Paraferrimonas sp. SM1919 TaxID=2662263 RepID=UPI0013D4703C|nr:carbohydrate binding family 9 domain-containing protein [Paraferrimonas sp. SM1919]